MKCQKTGKNPVRHDIFFRNDKTEKPCIIPFDNWNIALSNRRGAPGALWLAHFDRACDPGIPVEQIETVLERTSKQMGKTARNC